MPPFNISVHTALTLQRMNLPWLVGHDSVPSMVGRSESEAEGNAGDVSPINRPSGKANACSHHSRTSANRFQEAGLQRICTVPALLLEGLKERSGKHTVEPLVTDLP